MTEPTTGTAPRRRPKRFGDPAQHPKIIAVQVAPKGSLRGKMRTAVEPTAPVDAPDYIAEPFIAPAAPVSQTKTAADAFAAKHPEGTKALLARLLKEREDAFLPVAAAREAEGLDTPILTDDQIAAIWAAPITTPAIPAAPVTSSEQPTSASPTTVATVQRPRAEPVTPAGMSKPEATTSGAAVVGTTREAWMLRAVEAMRSWLPDGNVVPDVRISFGWPGGRGSKKGVRGQCWYATDDEVPAIFVSPDQNDPIVVLGIILHEMVHASGQRQHNPGGFGKVAGPMGFTKSFTTSENKTPELLARLTDLAAELGPMDHARVNAAGGLYGTGAQRPPVQSTRMVKLTCPDDGYTVRTTRKWIEVGLPTCPCGEDMVADQDGLDALAPAPTGGEL